MLFTSLLLTLAPTADAREADATELAPYFTHQGSVELEGTVDLPLFACGYANQSSCVELTLESGDKYLMAIAPGIGGVYISPGLAGALDAEATEVKIAKGKPLEGTLKKPKTTLDGGQLERLDLGGVVFTDLAFFSPELDKDDKEHLEDVPDQSRYGGIIGLNHFSDLNWALLRSEGVLRLSTAESVLGAVKATPVATTYVPASVYQRGTVFSWLPSLPLAVSGQVDGKDTQIVLGVASTAVHRGLVADRPADFSLRTSEYHTLSIAAAGLSLDVAAREEGLAYVGIPDQLWLGQDYLWAADWAFDATSEQVALAWSVKDGRGDWNEILLAEVSKALAPPEADPETGEVPPGPEGEALAALQSALASAHDQNNGVDAELAALRSAVEADPESCATHHDLGVTLLDYGQPVEALVNLQKASALWDAWDSTDEWEKSAWRFWTDDLKDGSLEERLKRSLIQTAKLQWRDNIRDGLKIYFVGGQMAEREDAGLEPNVRIQPNSCGDVWGDMAGAMAAMGDLAGVNTLYAERLDFDSSVALATGNARLTAGDSVGANEAYRQALRLGSTSARFGTALIQLQNGNTDAALTNMSELVWRRGGDLDWMRRYYLALAQVEGPAAAADEMARRASLWPENPTLPLAAAEAGLHAGRDASGWVTRALRSYELYLEGPAGTNGLLAQYSAALLLDGRIDDARASAEKALRNDPAQSTALTTLGMIAALEGDTDSAKTLMEQARVAGIWDPAYAVMKAN